MRIRIRIREQLCLLISITSLLALMVLSVTTWEESYHFISQTRSGTLAVIANLKADQIAQDLFFCQDLVQAVSTRSNVQSFLVEYNNGNDSSAVLNGLTHEIESALAGGLEDSILLQAAIFPRTDKTAHGRAAIVNATGKEALNTIAVPYNYPNGSHIYLGDPGAGYPPSLYPNFTWSDQTHNVTHVTYENDTLYYNSTLMLGPMLVNDGLALFSMTVAINNNTSRTDILGWITVVFDARLQTEVQSDGIGLGSTGQILVVSPVPASNLFDEPVINQPASRIEDVPVNFLTPPASNKTYDYRHSIRAADPSLPFEIGQYPCALHAYASDWPDAGALLSTHNEQNHRVSCGYALVQSPIVDWAIIVEFSHSEAYAPIRRLRNAILICVFSVFAAIIIICFPLAHYAVKPIRALRGATENSIMTYEADVLKETASSQSDPESLKSHDQLTANGLLFSEKRCKRKPKLERRRQFQIPEKVPDHKHLIHDELTDLTSTFNEMSDELKIQYNRLEDRVRTRTIELERSRDLARAADESKTLFIANVSHELRTPLNGIIGMCAVAMQEEEVQRVRQSLNIIYKSSDLLLHLLNDLLTFSRNSYGQKLSIEEGIFRLVDVGTQLVSIFEKQARESDISLKVVFIGPNDPRQDFDDAPEDAIYAKRDVGGILKRVKTNVLARGPADTGPLRDMSLCGDKNRILQVLMNLVSNSLKFTPAGGMVEVRIKCRGFATAFAPTERTGADSGASTAVQSSAETAQDPGMPLGPPARQLDFEFQVEDTGPGIPEHLQQEIFKPFVQGDLALSRKHGGTGLGLAICAQLATLMRGGINLRSTVDIGSTFTLSIPLGYTKEKAPSVAGSLVPGSRRGSVRPPSLGDSGHMEVLSNKSRPPTRSNKTQPASARVSVYSGYDETPQMDLPRIVGFSQPFITDAREDPENDYLGPGNAEATASKQKAEALRNRLESIASVPDSNDRRPSDDKEKSAAEEKPKPKPAPAKPANIKVLVAEDNKVNQEVIMRMLKLEKLTDVKLAEDGKQALDIVRDTLEEGPDGSKCSPYQLVFMDIQMPNMDGIESTRHIRELGFHGPIVALTAFDHETNREACKEAGMDDFLPKPLKRTALKKILEQFRPTPE